MTFEDGSTVKWVKGKNRNDYTVNGVLLENVGHGAPDAVAALGVSPLKIGGTTLWPQAAPQFTGQVFLLDQSGAVVAEAVADVEKVGKLTKALKLSESEKRSVNADLKVRRGDEKTLSAEMDAFDGLDDAASLVAVVESLLANSESVALQADELEALKNRLGNYQVEVEELSGVHLIKCPSRENAKHCVAAQESLYDTERLRERLLKARGSVSDLSGIEDLDMGLESVDAVETKARKVSTALGYFSGVRDRLQKAVRSIVDLEALLATTAEELDGVRVTVQDALGDLGECPVCGVHTSGSHDHAEAT